MWRCVVLYIPVDMIVVVQLIVDHCCSRQQTVMMLVLVEQQLIPPAVCVPGLILVLTEAKLSQVAHRDELLTAQQISILSQYSHLHKVIQHNTTTGVSHLYTHVSHYHTYTCGTLSQLAMYAVYSADTRTVLTHRANTMSAQTVINTITIDVKQYQLSTLSICLSAAMCVTRTSDTTQSINILIIKDQSIRNPL